MRWDREELNWAVNSYPKAPCHTCSHRDNGEDGGASCSCSKYPIPRYSIGNIGKPTEVLTGIAPCEYYQKG